MWKKKQVYVVTIWLKEEDEEGELLNWSESSEERYADTLEEARNLKEKLMSGQDEFYGDLIEDVLISNEKEEREFFVKPVSVRENWRTIRRKPEEKTLIRMLGSAITDRKNVELMRHRIKTGD